MIIFSQVNIQADKFIVSFRMQAFSMKVVAGLFGSSHYLFLGTKQSYIILLNMPLNKLILSLAF